MFDYRKDNLFIKAIIHELGHLIVGYIHGIVNTNNLIKLYVKADADRIDGHIIIYFQDRSAILASPPSPSERSGEGEGGDA